MVSLRHPQAQRHPMALFVVPQVSTDILHAHSDTPLPMVALFPCSPASLTRALELRQKGKSLVSYVPASPLPQAELGSAGSN